MRIPGIHVSRLGKVFALGLALACVNLPQQPVHAQSGAATIADLIMQTTVIDATVMMPPAVPMPRKRPGGVRAHTASASPANIRTRAPWAPATLNAGRISSAERKAVDQAISLISKGDFAGARRIANGLRHPVAKGTVQYIILRQPKNGSSVDDYAAFLFKYADWPTERIRSRMEAAMIEQSPAPASVLHILNAFPPVSGKGRLALALAQQATGQTAQARATIRASWRRGDIYGKAAEDIAMRRLSGHLGGNDHAVRMRALFYNDDNVSGLRAAARLDAAQAKLGKAWPRSTSAPRMPAPCSTPCRAACTPTPPTTSSRSSGIAAPARNLPPHSAWPRRHGM